MTSSSEALRRPLLLDLAGELPPPPGEDFAEAREFERVLSAPAELPSADEMYKRGLFEGEQLGRQSALKELAPALAELGALAASLARIREQRLADAEAEIAQVAAQVAEHILHGELAQAGDTVLRMARACIAEAAEDGPRVLRVAESDLELLRAHLPELELDLADGALSLQAASEIAPGTVVLETRTRCYDGRPARILRAALARLETGEGA